MVKIANYEARTTVSAGGVEAGPMVSGEVGRAVAGMGRALTEAEARLTDQMDKAAAKRADTAYRQSQTELLYGEKGLYSLDGEDALNAAPKVREQLKQAREKAQASLTPWQAKLFASVADEQDLDLERQIGSYTQRAEKKYLTDVSVGRQATATQQAEKLYALDPEGFEKAMVAVRSEIVGRGDLNGSPPELVKAEWAEAEARVYGQAITGLLADDPARAREALEKHADKLAPETAARLRVQVKGAADQADAAAWAETLPAGSTLGAIEARAKELGGADPERVKAFRHAGEDAYRRHEAVEREAREKLIDAAWVYVEQGQTPPPAIWQSLKPQDRDGLRAQLRSNAAAGGAGGAGDVAAQVIYGTLNDMAVDDPQTFAKADLTQLIGKVSNSDYQELVRLQRDVRKGGIEAAAKRASLERVSGLAGLNVPKGVDPKAFSGEVFRATQGLKDPTDADILAVVDRLARARVGNKPVAKLDDRKRGDYELIRKKDPTAYNRIVRDFQRENGGKLPTQRYVIDAYQRLSGIGFKF